MARYPHRVLTSPHEWDPHILDHRHDDQFTINVDSSIDDPRIDELGYYTDRMIMTLSNLSGIPPVNHQLSVNTHAVVKTQEIDYNKYKPFFGWVNADTIRNTFNNTTQYADVPMPKTTMRKHYKTRFPVLNVQRRHEPVATDTLFSDTPAVYSGVTKAQLFVGKESLVADIYPLKSGAQFVNTLEDVIREREAMSQLIRDSAKTKIINMTTDIL